MADFALLIHPNPNERQKFLYRARSIVTRRQGLAVHSAEIGKLAAVWGHAPCAPHSIQAGKQFLYLLLGYALAEHGPRLEANQIADLWLTPEPNPQPLDGYHAAIVWSVEQGLLVGTDPLGMFPIYHAYHDGLLVVASTPELCALHEKVSGELDPQGLAGILLVNGLIGERTLLKGVRRLTGGSHLKWTPSQGLLEVETYHLSPHQELQNLSSEEVLECADATLRRAIRRHQPVKEQAGLMLSGGLDSRLMAGYLTDLQLINRALTLGLPTDLEWRAAQDVARTLGLELQKEDQEPPPKMIVDAAQVVARSECLAGGFSSLAIVPEADTVGRMSAEFWSGYAADDILGGYAARYGRNADSTGWSARNFFARTNRWGLAPETCGALLSGAGGPELVRQQMDLFCRQYEAGAGNAIQQSFRMKLATRIRYHIGGILHRLSFRSWPLLPVLDRRVLELFFNIDFPHLAERQLEHRLLNSYFPRLATIPLDTNSFRFEAPSQGARFSVGVAALSAVRRKTRQWYWRSLRRREPRRYYRAFDLNGPGWQAVRIAAEPGRKMLPGWLDPEIVKKLLPPPRAAMRFKNPFAEGTTSRILLGLCLQIQNR